MIIRCPKCNFAKTVDDKSIPASAQMATCPKCRHRFNFRETAVDEVSNPENGDAPISEQNRASDDDAVTPRTAAKRYEGIANIEKNGAPQGGRLGNAPENEKKDLWDSIEALGDQWEKKDQPGSRPQARPETPFAGNETGNEESRSSRDEASDNASAYRRPAATRPQRANAAPGYLDPNGIPWELARGAELAPAFFITVSRAILSAPRFFTSLRLRQPSFRAVIFYILANFLPVFINLIYFLSFRKAELEPFFTTLEMTVTHFLVGVIIASPVQALISLLFFTVITNTVLHVLGITGVNFNKTLRVMAYTGAPTILSFVPIIGPPAALFLGIVVSAQALRYSYALSWRNVVMTLLPGYLLVMVIFISTLRIFLSALS